MESPSRVLTLGSILLFFCAARLTLADVQMKTQAYPNNKDGFAAISKRIEDGNGRNLLARKDVRVFGDAPNPRELVDGNAGVAAGEGRVFFQGKPSVVTFYLGQAKPIHEIGVFSFNGDSRSNQDFEVRLVDNSEHPGQMPKFPDAPTCTSGPKILGANGGGFQASFSGASNKPIVEKADWIEFRIWCTYPSKAGDPAKTDKITGATVAIELEVLGDPKDVVVISPEERARTTMLRQMGNHPPYEKRATWQETMLATREAILDWECDLDQLVLPRAGVNLGGWKMLGPISADSEEAKQIERLGKVDLEKPLTIKKTELTWKPCEIKDGQFANLAEISKAKPGQVVVLCRSLEMTAEFAGREGFSIGIGAAAGRFRVIGGGSNLSVTDGLAAPNERAWALHEKPGKYHVLAILPVSTDGKCDFWFMPQPPTSKPGAGTRQERISRRQSVYSQVRNDFKDPVSQMQIRWEQADHIWTKFQRKAMAGREYFPTDWAPGKPLVIAQQYNTFAAERLEKLEKELATIEPAIRAKVEPWLAKFKAAPVPTTFAQAQARYYLVASIQEAMAEHHRIESMRLAVKDQQQTFGDKYPSAPEYLNRVDELEKQMNAAWPTILGGQATAMTSLTNVSQKIADEGKQILLANPLLGFEKLLLGKGGPGFASNWGGPNNIGGEIVTLSPVKPDGQITTVYKSAGSIHDMDLSFDGKKILFSSNVRLHEVNVDGTGYRQITNHEDKHTKHYDACRLPNGKIMFVSTACEQAVPCTGEWYVGNMHLIDDDGKNERRLCFDQDHDWNPCLLNNGQVIYTRWEYTDTPHYFTRLLFTMNPDGSNQTEFYGSNSYWPNAMYWPKPIPGHPSRIVCIVSGHHGVSRVGQMVILDTAQGRHEADGVVQRIGERGKAVEPVIEDGLVAEWWPRFAWPYPLAEPGSNKGAGKYFLVNCKMDEQAPWGVYLVDTFDNMTPLLMGNFAEPIPLRARPTPPVIPDRVDPKRTDAQVYMVDVYKGGGIKGFPRGSVKALRVGAHEYRYGGNGDTYAASYEGGWDCKQILGTVPVEEDGSAFFKVPANTPIFVQPLDAQGRSLAVMRSWFTAMPGETLSCVGCHERGKDTAPQVHTLASRRPASEITPWYGPARGFGFEREVQPVLDRKCAGCHDGANKDGKLTPDFRSKQIRPDKADRYSPAYMALAPYVRRPGYEADYHLNAPAEWHVSTSPLFQMLDKGHHNVQLTKEERDRLITWIDLNVPYAANWRESSRPPEAEQVDRRAKYKNELAKVCDCSENPMPLPPVGKFEPPAPEASRPAPMKLEGWPLVPEQAAQLQQKTGLREITLDLGNGVTMTLVPIPAGKFVMGDVNGLPDEFPQAAVSINQPFFMGKIEVSNRQYAQFDPSHDSAYIEARGKDRFTRGYPANEPEQPVIRITWKEAMAFCQWLSQKTGYECMLPTEAEWEWACRGGSATAWNFGDSFEKQTNFANIADSTLTGWGWGRVDRDYSDGARFSIPGGKYKPNAWGLCDMHGNVAEWTRSDYRAYPYVENDGRNGLDPLTAKVVRGGSWNDTFKYSRSASRLSYLPCQPVYNVGFRVVCKPAKVAQTR